MLNSAAPRSYRLGILSDASSQLGFLVNVIRQSEECEVVCTALTATHEAPLRTDIDAWLVSLVEHSERAEELILWLNEQDIPTVVDDSSGHQSTRDIKSAEWYAAKVRNCLLSQNAALTGGSLPERVWVIGASTGGPEAVSSFLSRLGESAKRNAYFYAQHIDEFAWPSLIETIGNHSDLRLKFCDDGDRIEAGTLYLVSPEREFEITENHQIVSTGRAWNGQYKPSINQVIAKIARVFGPKSGALIFSGMGDDGSESLRLLQAAGGKVYVQSPQSCTIDSMPVEALKTDCVSATGTSKELADYVNHANLTKNRDRYS